MQTFNLLLIISVVLANFGDVEIGRLLISDPLGDVFMKVLRANARGELSTHGKFIYVRPEEDGSLKEMTRQRYLNINDDDRVVFGPKRQPGFSIAFPSQQLLFKGVAGFIVCADGLVCFKNSGVNANPTFIIYREVTAALVFKELRAPTAEWYGERLKSS